MNLIEINNRKGKLKLTDGVHKESADKLIEQLETLYGPSAVAAQMRIGEVVCSADDALESVEVEINSPGGSVFAGAEMINAIKAAARDGREVEITVGAMAASMAG
jgi:ClpP class serine protease